MILHKKALRFIYPHVCPVCRKEAVSSPLGLCADCDHGMLRIPGPACRSCGGELDSLKEDCYECQANSRRWDRAASAFKFDGLIRDCLHRFKFQGDTALQPFMVQQCVRSWLRYHGDVTLDMVVPVPLHWFRRMLRGYNQSELLAQGIARGLELPVQPVLKRRRWSSPQAGLSRRQRLDNLRTVFHLEKEISGKHILLVDDVLTTGTTLEMCTKILNKGAAASVNILTVARR